MNRTVTRALGTGALSAAAMIAAAGVASAHVTVVAPGAAQGGYTVLTVRVPTESDTASTTSVTVDLPNLTSARTEPMPGWTATVERSADDKATGVTWTADPGNPGVGPGQFQQFVLSAGPLPDEDTVSFPARQTYSDGKVVAWDQPATDGAEPEHPAPTLELAAASADEHAGHGGHSTGTSDTATTAAAESSSSDDTALWVAGAALVLGALGAALGLGSVLRGRRS
ncbi:YcnI family copper-binding membrane protein [Rhodococcoides kroppenstedtii]|uniref:YcnI family copper-binding membrane protein n=1 Tax=Rhodococcoides kroppenstedtii TaxID=293050 RepID=UPI001427C47B|nr:YcnI family protein [Rhodococcus kroppenstedtii]NIL80804.1 protein YcnI [Rhodococcus kroppenstedtii]